MRMSVEDKVVVITGDASGIGRQLEGADGERDGLRVRGETPRRAHGLGAFAIYLEPAPTEVNLVAPTDTSRPANVAPVR
jgi:NADP-dependent 3-hydroxy acid dehydrogenase YdfG